MPKHTYITPDGTFILSAFKSRRQMLDAILGSSDTFADQMEVVARVLKFHGEISKEKADELFSLAWDLKQINRVGTPSEGL